VILAIVDVYMGDDTRQAGNPFRSRHALLAAATLLPLAAGVILVFVGSLRPRVGLEEIAELARSGRFDDARSRGEAYLRSAPDDPRALLVLAEVALSRPAAEPRRALEYLDRIRPDSPALAAWVLVDRGRAQMALGCFDRAEGCWDEALRRDPSALEAGRRLLDLLGLQGRVAEARALALRLFDREPTPTGRVRLLLRLARLDVDPPEPWSVVNRFEPAVRAQTADLPTTIACGLALVTVSRFDDGLAMLRRAVEQHPDSPQAWDALLSGLEIASRREEMPETFARVPGPLTADARFARHRGWLALEAGRWREAVEAYRIAWGYHPDNAVGYRLRRALALSGATEESGRYDRLVLDYRDAFKRVRVLIDEADAMMKDGKLPHWDLYAPMADLRERMCRSEEAAAWRRMMTAFPRAHRAFPPGPWSVTILGDAAAPGRAARRPD
jgi:tetratricopeptide (TPR) repeat protein